MNCVVPYCKSSPKTTPEKLFIQVPNDKRKVWLEIAKLDPTLYSQKTKLRFCEDHFDLEKDMENYMQYKLMGSVKRIRITPNCKPSRFDCQPGRCMLTSKELESIKREHKSLIEEILITDSLNSSLKKSDEFRERNLKMFPVSKIISKIPESNELQILKDIKIEAENNDGWVQKIKAESLHIGEVIIKDEIDFVQCSKCSQLVNTESELLEHKCKQLYKCDICDNSYAKIVSLERHKSRKHLIKNCYKCTFCNKLFSQKCIFTDHERGHTGERPFVCLICNKSFQRKFSLRSHESIHTGVKPYKCSICQKSFRLKSNYIQHKRVHTGERPYKCTLCKKTFTHNSSLFEHKHLHIDDGVYKCKTCQILFQNKHDFKEHKIIHRGKRRYRCAVCKKAFLNRDHLTKHQRIHTGIKPFGCSFCNQSFLRKHNLILHHRLHTGERPHKCFHCDKSFIQPAALNSHVRSAHTNKIKTNKTNKAENTDLSHNHLISTNTNEENNDNEILKIINVTIKKEDHE